MSKSSVQIITRADDCGNSHTHNRAILECCSKGIVKNVSVMATGAALEDAASLFSADDSICFGLHVTMNSEWERFRWKPLLSPNKVPSLVDPSGYFLPHPGHWLERPVLIEHILMEMDAQLSKLIDSGFHIRYADTHMCFEWAVPGMAGAFNEWCDSRGLISYRRFDIPLPISNHADDRVKQLLADLDAADSGQYVVIGHPGYDDEQTRGWGNAEYPGIQVAYDREQERRMYTDPEVLQAVASGRVSILRYDEAVPQKECRRVNS